MVFELIFVCFRRVHSTKCRPTNDDVKFQLVFVFGTYITIATALRYEVSDFIVIASTNQLMENQLTTYHL